eukprot:gene6329-4556_t
MEHNRHNRHTEGSSQVRCPLRLGTILHELLLLSPAGSRASKILEASSDFRC